MNLFSKINKKEGIQVYKDNEIIAVANAKMIPANQIGDPAFAQEMLGQTIGFDLKDGVVVAPVNGKLEVMFPTGHAFGLRMANGTGLLVHIGIDTVELEGKGFEVFAKQGDNVKAGQVLVKVDTDKVKQAGYDTTTMLIITENVRESEKMSYIAFGEVKRGQVINN